MFPLLDLAWVSFTSMHPSHVQLCPRGEMTKYTQTFMNNVQSLWTLSVAKVVATFLCKTIKLLKPTSRFSLGLSLYSLLVALRHLLSN